MTTRRVGSTTTEWVAERLSGRDWQIIEAVNVVRLLTGSQIERLFFGGGASGRSRIASRSRALHRLVVWRVLVPLPRRIGGAGRGSTTLAFALDSAGQRLMRERQLASAQRVRVRRPGAPTERTVRHTLTVAEAYVALTESGREHGFTLATFQAEPASWWPNGLGGYIKPDAYARLTHGRVSDHWWCELDLAWGEEGTTREQRAWTADPDLVRRLDVGQACYIQRGAATFVQVARPRPSPLTLLPPPAAPDPAARVPEPRREPATPAWPDPPGSLDDVFGPGATR